MLTNVLVFRHGGTHLTLPLIRKLTKGKITDIIKLRQSPEGKVSKGRFVISWRDPRNVIVSKIRYDRLRRRKLALQDKDEAVCNLLLRTMISKRWADSVGNPGISWMGMLQRVSRRWADVDGFWMPFEIITDSAKGEALADRLAEYLGGVDGARQWNRIYGTGKSFTGEPSDWREWFGKPACRLFKKQGGLEVLERLGYKW